MRFWRLVREKAVGDAFTGEGARLWSGRWNPRGLSVVYVSEHLSLAVLEVLVSLDEEAYSESFVAFGGEIPEDLEVSHINASELPADWRAPAWPEVLQRIGRDWILGGRSVALSVPSAGVPQERNILLNPAHPDFARLTIGPPEPFWFDTRLH